MEYPYREKFLSWAKDVKHYRESTVMLYDYTVNSFYNYFYSQSEHGNDIRLVRPQDITNYLVNIQEQHHIVANTANKYYFHLKKYFTFLYSNHLIDKYPLIDLKTYKVNKYTNITLGWQQYLPEIFKIAELSDDAKLELFLISQNIEPKGLLNITFGQLRNFNTENIGILLDNIEVKPDNYFVFSLKNDPEKPLNSLNSLLMRVRPDEEILNMTLAPSKLRQSYIYNYLLTNKDKSEIELLNHLHLSIKSLVYYRQNLLNIDFNEYVHEANTTLQ